MSSRFQRALEQRLQSDDSKAPISPPRWLDIKAVHYECMMGSKAYGVSNESSDEDIYGFVIPPKDSIFPHLAGHIQGFGKAPNIFEQYQQHHIQDPDAQKEYDFSFFSIVKFFELCRQNNPNMIDSLFVPTNCVFHITAVGTMVRDARKLFLSKQCWPKFKGYAYAQVHKLKNKAPSGKRLESVEKFGYDVKFAYHIVRLMNEVEQIMSEGDLDLQRNREQLKAIRRGEWSEEQLLEYFSKKELALETVHSNCKLPEHPPEGKLRQLLMDCLEHHYGKISQQIQTQVDSVDLLRQIHELSGKGLAQ